MVNIAVIGNVPPQSTAVLRYLLTTGHSVLPFDPRFDSPHWLAAWGPRLIVVAGYRRLLPKHILDIAPTIGFHSAKLPEYPGRAPVAWAYLRDDGHTYNTMLYLDAGVDSGDVIADRYIPLSTPEATYGHIAATCVEMLAEHLPALLAGTAPRSPQDPSRRGPLTAASGWDLLKKRRHGLVLGP